MSNNGQTKLQPLDSFVLAGFAERFAAVFGAKCAYTQSNDKARIIERVFGQGKDLEYPYAYFTIQSLSPNVESYQSNYWARRGIPVTVNSGSTIQTVRVLPVNFEIELTYVTNKLNSIDQGSVLAFARRWLMARRAGYLKFSIDYGRLQLGVGITLSDSVPVPQRENVTESIPDFPVVVSATLHGYVSEPILGTEGKVNQFNVNEEIGLAKGEVLASSQFFAFPNSD